MLVWTGLALWQMFHPVRFSSLFGRGIRDRIVWATPVAHGIARDRGLADAFDLIAGAVQNGMPIDRAFAEAANLEINAALRDRFERWAQAILGGASLADAARAARMPRLVAAMLANVRGGERGAAKSSASSPATTRRATAEPPPSLYGAAVPLVVFFFAHHRHAAWRCRCSCRSSA